MTLAKRIVPSLLVKGHTIYKGERYNCWRSIGHALQGARVHASRGVDELLIADVSATDEGRLADVKMVRELTEGCFIPVTVGGGIRTLNDIDTLLRSGADKCLIGTAAVEVKGFVAEASRHFGRQAIVCSVDIRDGFVTARCGKEWVRPSLTAKMWAMYCESEGAGEILLSCVDRDGMMQGYDLDLIREVSQAVDIPVIASGGCGSYEHMLEAFRAGADACASGAMFAFTDNTPRGAAQYLKQHGVEVRL